MWLMGDPFFRAYYTIFDLETYKIGFVGKAQSRNIDDDESLTFILKLVQDLTGIPIASEDQLVVEIIFGCVSVLFCFYVCCCCQYCFVRFRNNIEQEKRR